MNDEAKQRSSANGLVRWIDVNRVMILRWLVVFGLAVGGMGLFGAGALALVVGEDELLWAGATAGSILIGAGGLGFLRCLDQ